jgi:hypothetical protein
MLRLCIQPSYNNKLKLNYIIIIKWLRGDRVELIVDTTHSLVVERS